MMIRGLYFPDLNRQLVTQYYKNGSTEFYATYNCKHNYNNIALDCQYRCVYCDVHVDECGGEKFSLDHFRPQNIFGEKFDGVLNTHPFNLHLSCQKCNVLKSDDWKGCVQTQNGETYLLKKGYIDRFQVDASDYFDVNEMGQIVSINDEGPGDYMIKRLLLNRTNRVHIRKLREVNLKIDTIKELLAARQNEVMANWNSNVISDQQAKEKMGHLTSLLNRFAAL